MTTCVAGSLGNGTVIGLVADKMLSTGEVESPVGYKILTLHKNWRVMYAGNDIGPAIPIVARAKKALKSNARPTSEEIALAIAASWKVERFKRSEHKFLSPFNLTMAQFYKDGKAKLTEAQFSKLFDQISDTELDLQLLIAGFDENKAPSIMAVDMEMRGMPDQMGNFSAIGSGMKSALMMLNFRELKPSTPVREGLAYLVEAKLYGERAPSVSTETDVILMRPDLDDIVINDDDVEKVLFEKIAITNEPRQLQNSHLLLLNDLKDLEGFPYVTRGEKRKILEVPYDSENKPVRPKKKWIKAAKAGSVSQLTNPPVPPRTKRGRTRQPASQE